MSMVLYQGLSFLRRIADLSADLIDLEGYGNVTKV